MQYIPPLKTANPERFAVAVCSVDGQFHSFGDADDFFTLQSVSKPITYAAAVQCDGAEFVDSFVWCEPSGRPFNSHDLLPDQVHADGAVQLMGSWTVPSPYLPATL